MKDKRVTNFTKTIRKVAQARKGVNAIDEYLVKTRQAQRANIDKEKGVK